MRTQKPKPTESSTLTIRLKADVKERLAQLSASTNRTRSFLAAEAIAAYVMREHEIVDAVALGIADVKAGRTVAHSKAMDELDAVIDEVTRAKA